MFPPRLLLPAEWVLKESPKKAVSMPGEERPIVAGPGVCSEVSRVKPGGYVQPGATEACWVMFLHFLVFNYYWLSPKCQAMNHSCYLVG